MHSERVSPSHSVPTPTFMGLSESDSPKASTLPAVGKGSSTWCWSFQFRYVPSLATSPHQSLSAEGHLPFGRVGTAVNSASWGPYDQRTQNLRPVPGQCGGGWGLRARAGLAEIYPRSPVLAPRTSPWGRLQAKRSTPASSSTSSSPRTLRPPKTGETPVLSGSGVSPHSHLFPTGPEVLSHGLLESQGRGCCFQMLHQADTGPERPHRSTSVLCSLRGLSPLHSAVDQTPLSARLRAPPPLASQQMMTTMWR